MNLRSHLGAGLLIAFLIPGYALAITPRSAVPKGTAFAQLSSTIDQQAGGIVQFELKDSLEKMSATANSVVVEQEGTYLIIASPQVTATKDGGCLDAWLMVNGKNVKNSGVRICQAKAGNTNVVVSQSTMFLKKGDKLQVKTNGKNAKLDAITAKGEPLIPSIILSIMGLTY
jgi:hypothetical protein